MEDTNNKSSIVQAAPASMVPPGSANPLQPAGDGIQGGGGRMVLPKKATTIETVRSRAQEDRGEKREARSEKSEEGMVSLDSAKAQMLQGLASSGDAQSSVVSPEIDVARADSDSNSDSATDADADVDPIELPDLTKEQFAFLTSERYREASNMIKREFGMEDDDLSFLSEMEHAVLGGVIDLEQFISAMLGEFPRLNDTEKKRLIGILLAYRFEPFSDQLHPSPREAARVKDIKMAAAPYYRVYTKPLTFRGAANEVARMAGIDLMGQTQERLRDAIISRMKGIRTDGQLEELFMRSPEQAGLGLSEDKARIAREVLVELVDRARLMSEDEYARWLNDQIHKKKVSSASPQVVV